MIFCAAKNSFSADVNVGTDYGTSPYNIDSEITSNLILYPGLTEGTVNIISGGVVNGTIRGSVDGVGIVNIKTGYSDADAVFGTLSNSLKELSIFGGNTAQFANSVFADNVNIGDFSGSTAATVVLQGNLTAANININNDSEVGFFANSVVTGNITTEENNKGSFITYNSNTQILNQLGSQDKKLELIQIFTADVPGLTVNNAVFDVRDSVFATKILFSSVFANSYSQTFKTSGDNDITIDANFVEDTAYSGVGAINNSVLSIAANTTIKGSIGNSTDTINSAVITSGKSLTLQGNNNYIDSVTLGGSTTTGNLFLEKNLTASSGILIKNDSVLTTQNSTSSLSINADITTNVNNTGSLIVNTNTVVNGNIGAGGAALKNVDVTNSNLTVKGNSTVSNINLNQGVFISDNTSGNLTVTGSFATTSGSGVIDVKGGNQTTINGQIGSSNSKLSRIDIEGGSTVRVNNSVFLNNINFINGGTNTFATYGSNTILVDANISKSSSATGNAALSIQGTTIMLGTVGSSTNHINSAAIDGANLTLRKDSFINNITVGAGSDSANLILEANLTATSIVLDDSSGVVTQGSSPVIITGDITTTHDNTGVVTINANTTMNGQIGDSGFKLNSVDIGDGKSFTIADEVYSYSVNLLNSSSDSVLITSGSSVTIHSSINTDSNGLGILNFGANSTLITGDIGSSVKKVKLIELSANKGATVQGDIYAESNCTAQYECGIVLNSNSFFSLEDSTVNSDIKTKTDGAGQLTISSGNNTILGQIGSSDKKLGLVNFIADANLAVQKDIYASSIILDNDSTLTVSGDQVLINSSIVETGAGTVSSEVILNANSTIITGQFLKVNDLKVSNGKSAVINGIYDSGTGLTTGTTNTKNITINGTSATTTLSFYKNVNATNITLSGANSILGIGELGPNSNNKIDTTIAYTNLAINGGKLRIESNHTYDGGTPAAGSADALLNAFKNSEIQVSAANLILNNDFDFNKITLLGQDTILTLAKDGMTVDGNIAVAGNNMGTLQVNGNNVTVSSDVGTSSNRFQSLNISNNKSLTLSGENYINNVNIGSSSTLFLENDLISSSIVLNDSSTLITKNASNLDIVGNITTEVPNSGSIAINSSTDISGTIGSSEKKLNSVYAGDAQIAIHNSLFANILYLDGNAELLTNGGNIEVNASIIALDNKQSFLTLAATNTKIVGNVADQTNQLSEILVDDNANALVTGTIYSDFVTVGVTASASLNILKDLTSSTGIVLNSNSILKVGDINDNVVGAQNVVIDGVITTGTNGTGILQINSTRPSIVTIKKQVGTSGARLASATIRDGTTLELQKDVFINEINFDNFAYDSVLKTSGTSTVSINGAITTDTSSFGILDFATNTVVNGAVGGSVNKMADLKIADTKTVTLKGVSYINTVNVGLATGTSSAQLILENNLNSSSIVLNNGSNITTRNNAVTINGNITTENSDSGTLDFQETTSVFGNIGSSDKHLNALNASSDIGVTLEGEYNYINNVNIGFTTSGSMTLKGNLTTNDINLAGTLTTAGTRDITITGNVHNGETNFPNFAINTNTTFTGNLADSLSSFGSANVADGKSLTLKGTSYINQVNVGASSELLIYNNFTSSNINLANTSTVLGIGELGANANGKIDTVIGYTTLTTNGGAFAGGVLRIESDHKYEAGGVQGTANGLINLFNSQSASIIEIDTGKTVDLQGNIVFEKTRLTEGSTLKISQLVITGWNKDIIADQDNEGTVQIDAAVKSFNGNLGTADKALYSLNISDGSRANLRVNTNNMNYINNINVGVAGTNNAGILHLENNLTSAGAGIVLNNNSTVNIMSGASTVLANIVTETDNTGTVSVENDVNISGNIGSSSAKVGTINVLAAKNLTLSSLNNSVREEMYFNNIDMSSAGNNGSLTITGDTNGIFLGGNIGYNDATKQGLIVSIKGDIQYKDGVTQGQALGGLLGTNDANPYVEVKNNTLLFKTVDDSQIVAGNSFVISNSAVSNYFDDATLTYDSLTKKLTLSVVGTDLYVNVATGNAVYKDQLSPSAKLLGDIIDKKWSFSNMTGGESSVVANLQNLTQEEFDAGLEELTPNSVLEMQRTSLTAIKNSYMNITKRLQTLRTTANNEAGLQNVAALGSNLKYYQNFDNYRDLGKSRDYNNYSRFYRSPSDSRNFWGEVFGGVSSSTKEKTNKTDGFDANSYGFTLGYDYSPDKNWTFGGAYTFATNNAKTNGETDKKDSLDISSNEIGLYSMYKGKSFFTEVFGGLEMHGYDQTRNINFGSYDKTAKANYNGLSYNVGGALGYDFQLNQESTEAVNMYDNKKRVFAGEEKILFTPRISVLYSNLSVDDYVEKGADGANLNVTTQDKKVLEGEAGFTLSHNKLLQTNLSFLKEISIAVSYDFYNEVPELEAAFVDDPNNKFKVYGEDPDPISYHVGTAFNLNNSDSYTFGLRYDYSFNSEMRSHLVKLNFISKF